MDGGVKVESWTWAWQLTITSRMKKWTLNVKKYQDKWSSRQYVGNLFPCSTKFSFIQISRRNKSKNHSETCIYFLKSWFLESTQKSGTANFSKKLRKSFMDYCRSRWTDGRYGTFLSIFNNGSNICIFDVDVTLVL